MELSDYLISTQKKNQRSKVIRGMIDDDDVGPPGGLSYKVLCARQEMTIFGTCMQVITGKQFFLSQHSLQNTLRRASLS